MVNVLRRYKKGSNHSFLMFQADSVRDAAFGCDWVGTPIPFQRCLMFIIAAANTQFQLTAGKFVPVTNVTMINVRTYVCVYVCMGIDIYICVCVCVYLGGLEHMNIRVYIYNQPLHRN
jgi:hypothetical protein